MTGCSWAAYNFEEKFFGYCEIGQDEYERFIGYGDYKLVGFPDSIRVTSATTIWWIYSKVPARPPVSISLNDMMSASPVCLLTKASSTKSWLWHRRLNHLNFGTLNELARKNLVRGLPMLKYDKDHLCPSCQLERKVSRRKEYVCVIVDDYTRFGWVRFLRTKDETPHAIEKFIVKTQRALNATVRFVRTDNGTVFRNGTRDGCSGLHLKQMTSVAKVQNSTYCFTDRTQPSELGYTTVLDNKNLTIEKKNLLIKNDCLIAECLEKDICSIVLTSDIVVPPSSNCLCEDLRSACDREHTKVLELEAEISKQKQLITESEKRPTKGSCDQQAFETDIIQLKDTITSLRIQLDGLKVENLKRLVHGKTSSGPSTSEKPKVLASGMYTTSSKYIPPPKRANWVKPTPLPKKKQVTFQEPPRTSNRPTQKPPVQQNKKPNVPVHVSTRTKPATESRKPMPKCHTRNHHILPSRSVNARRAADHNRKLNVVDHNQFVIRSLKSVNTKTPQAKHSVNHTKKVWKATRNHNVNTTKTAWRPTRKVVGSVKPQWKPTGRYFALYDNCPLTRIMEPIVEPLELTPSVRSSSKVTMISRFTDCKLSDRKAGSKGSKGRTVADSIAARLTRPTAYKFKTDCSIIPVWHLKKTLIFRDCAKALYVNLLDYFRYVRKEVSNAELDYVAGKPERTDNKFKEEMLKGLILKLCHVKELEIGDLCLEALSGLEAKCFTLPSNIILI
ncbi:putative ribonuclease H-like domain-containing protein [Tanacetum coccineum]